MENQELPAQAEDEEAAQSASEEMVIQEPGEPRPEQAHLNTFRIQEAGESGDEKPNVTPIMKFRTIAKTIYEFVSLQDAEDVRRRKWKNRRLRHHEKSLGGLKQLPEIDEVDSKFVPLPLKTKPSVFEYAKDTAEYFFKPKAKTEDRVDHRDDEPGTYDPVGTIGDILQIELNEGQVPTFVRQQMDELEDYRPYFTYWISTVQIIIMIISLCWYGFGHIGTELHLKSDYVLTERVAHEQVAFHEPSNFWIGPRAADLIHLGAKFSPCMRHDPGIMKSVALARVKENQDSGCCVRNDFTGCMQTTNNSCSGSHSTFLKWSSMDNSLRPQGPNGPRLYGPVCGQDPKYCESPASQPPHQWPDNLQKWPICKKQSPSSIIGSPLHVTCKLTASPCCIGIHGRCEMRSKEYCDFVNGYFHPEATLCSQVTCMQDVCGMLSFVSEGSPDQFYRLYTSLFLHAGLIHLTISLIFQWFVMRDLERLCGPWRIACIYFGSGILGNAASAIFIPHKAESGPSGSHFGLLASLFIEVINAWPLLKSPFAAIGKLSGIMIVLFIAGFLPWVDNFAHIFGWIGGLFLSFSCIPYINFEDENGHGTVISSGNISKGRLGRRIIIALCILVYIGMVTLALLIFYLEPEYDCQVCKYLSCVPIARAFCAEQNIDFATETTNPFF